jgi:hypothetical protein
MVPIKGARLAWKRIFQAAASLSQAEIVRATDDAVKTAILDERSQLTTDDIIKRLEERQSMRLSFLDLKEP